MTAVIPSRPSGISWIYASNPFYFISALLMLYGVRAGYHGKLEIEYINCWIMLGVLAAYTMVLAGIAIAIVRWGKVWDDARSLLVVLLLLFLAVSISADDLFVKAESKTAGMLLVLGGLLGSSLLSELVLRCCRIRLGVWYRLPYHLMLALFFATPWYCSPALHPRPLANLEWIVFLFPTVAAGIFLLLVPAVRKGATYLQNNGTPWPYPIFPWTMFGVIASAVAFRSFVLSLTFTPHGATWNQYSRTLSDINFSTIFGPYFLVPLAFVVMWLVLEGSLVSANYALQKRLLAFAPVLLLMAYPYQGGQIYRDFLGRVTGLGASPLWMTICLLMVFYGRAWLSRVRHAEIGCYGMLLLSSVIGRQAIDPGDHEIWETMLSQPWPFAVAGIVSLVHGIWSRSSLKSIAGAAMLVLALGVAMPPSLQPWRMAICYHLMWVAVLAIGLLMPGEFSRLLRGIGALQWPLITALILVSDRAQLIPWIPRAVYLVVAAVAALVLMVWNRRKLFLFAISGEAFVVSWAITMIGYRIAVEHFGRAAMATITMSAGALLIAVLISARKANWLPTGMFPGGRNLSLADQGPTPSPGPEPGASLSGTN